MSKDKISDYSATANSNTDIGGINIDEGCAPSGINDAIRTLMKQLKDFQQGTNSDSFNGPHNGTVGATTPASGAFTTLSASSTLSVTGAGTIQGLTVGRGAGAVSTNTAVGVSALATNSTGDNNTGIGNEAGYSNSTGVNNVAVGSLALRANTASQNVAVGVAAMYANTSGTQNVAIGSAANYASMRYNTTGSYNVAVGAGSLAFNTTASNNTAVGYQAGYSNTTGNNNVFIGAYAGNLVTTGLGNTFVGRGPNSSAGDSVTTGSKNTIIGAYTGNNGGLDIRTASNNIVLSDGDGTPQFYISSTGATYTSLGTQGPYNNTSASAANFIVFSNGSIGRSTSALKYKQDIRDVEDFDINLLRPVRYKSKCENDDQTKDHLGLIADEAAEAGFEELVTRGADGEIEGFQYERLTVVLLKELQTLKAKVAALENK